MLLDDNKVFNPKYWFMSIVGFIVIIVVLCNLWLYREFYINQKAAVEEVVEAVSNEINYKLTTIENLLISTSKNFSNQNIAELSDQEIIDSLKVPSDILKYITRIKITPIIPSKSNLDSMSFEPIKLAAEDDKLYFVIANRLSKSQKNESIQVYFDINEIAQKYLAIEHRSFELQFLFKIRDNAHYINYLLHSNKNSRALKINDIALYNLLDNNNLKLSQNNFVLGNPDWQIKGYLKQEAIKNFIKILILISLLFILVILFISNLAYRRLCNLEKMKSKAVSDKEEAQAKINYLAYYDGLTRLPNKTSLIRHYDNIITHENLFINDEFKLFTAVINIPMLKEVNDTIGYQYGDHALIGFAKRVNDFLNSPDVKKNILHGQDNVFFRSGGNTFVLSIIYKKKKHGKSHILFITNFINMLLSEVTQPIKIKEEDLYFSYYSGISIYPDDFKNITLESNESLLRYAEIAMSAARKKGLNKYIFYSEDINTSMLTIFNLENELKRALVNNKLELLLQPQASLKNNRLRGFEALIRWQREDGSIVSPGTFIPILEKSGLIVTVGDWILREACTQAIKLLEQGIEFETLSVNISVLQLQSENFIDRMTAILDATMFPHDKFEIEVTESILFEVPDKIIKVLNDIKAKNIKIALDDFGTGFSSLSYLKILPIDYLKIDKSFVNDLQESGDSRLLLAILAIAKSMGIFSIVEGVESRDQVDFLRTTSCDIIQGYYVSKALSLSEVIKLYSGKMDIL